MKSKRDESGLAELDDLKPAEYTALRKRLPPEEVLRERMEIVTDMLRLIDCDWPVTASTAARDAWELATLAAEELREALV